MHIKTIRLILLAILLISIVALTVSCGFSAGTDGDDNGGDTVTPVDTTRYLPITSAGDPKITIVSAYSKTKEFGDAYRELTSVFKEAGINFSYTYAASEDKDAPEILIGGGISAKGDYYVDPHSLGNGGYVIRVVGNKVIIAGGSDSSLAEAVRLFKDSVLNLDDKSTDVKNLAIDRSTDILIREDYSISSVLVGGNDIFGYDIVCDTNDPDLKYCADTLHNMLYSDAGYWLDVRSTSANPSININLVDYAGEDGFRVYVEGTDLMIDCAYPTLLRSTFDRFIDEYFTSRGGGIVIFGDLEYTIHISTVRYSDFGAVGDGVTDDYDAIEKAHNAANPHGQTVVADSGKTYNLGTHASAITVSTSVDWTGATFIIDDSSLLPNNAASNSNVFLFMTDNKYTVRGITSLSKGQKNVGVTFSTPVILHIKDGNKMQYIRQGINANAGSPQQEIILVDKDGNVDPSTPILWDYETVTTAYAYSAVDTPITIKGGHFITVANAAPRESYYYKRGIGISRSNVTVDGLKHTITGEGAEGSPYTGFIAVSYCNNVLIKDTVLTGHKVYYMATNESNPMGTYDISVTNANNVTFKDCTQTNSITDKTYWGIMGSNYAKNLTYDGCVFSRFDAHKGTHNATIINSEIGYQKLSIIGSGTLRVENTTIHGNNIVTLRDDYGSTWDGDMIFKNITMKNTGTVTIISAKWVNHYYGYTCYLPANITIDGITLASKKDIYVLPNLSNGIDGDTVSGSTNKNKVVLTEKVTVLSNPNGYTYYLSKNTQLFADVEFIKQQ